MLLFSLCAVPSAFGQSNYAAVTGAVTDPQHSPIAGAAVVLTAKETHAGRRVSTNAQGIFQITGLLPGDYELVVESQGFAQLAHPLRLVQNNFGSSLGEPNRAFLEALPATVPAFVKLAFSPVP